ncbi:macrophage mannose receptor 1-like [Oreochromis niloticus]|uniref:macrophage mannose receptor 1-like n=1 Tax=Oreochromis niloticus TaxID=8128 RepID=UPI000DF3A316|nr:macrophage mannose receptor 1-like [Oreochromis niloticus]
MMKRISAIYLTFLSVFCSFTLGSSDFHLITLTENYTQAKNYCRVMYTDLATIYNLADMNNLVTFASNITERAWIGLEMGAVWMWHWSLPGQVTDFLKWKSGEVITHNQEECAAMDQFGGWFVSACGVLRKFVCQGNHTGYFIFVNESKSWWDAQSHCRNLSPDLVSIHSEAENMAVLNVSASQSVWIGLFKDPWIWSDGSNSSFRFWGASQPSYLHNQDCVAAVFQDNGKWNEQNCSNQLNFVCHGAAATKQSSTTTTTEGTAAGGVRTPNTTEFMSPTSSTHLQSTTTEMSSLTQPPPATTVNLTTGGDSILTTPGGISAWIPTTQTGISVPNTTAHLEISPQNTTIQKGTSAQNTTTYIGSSTQNTTAFMGTSAQNTTTYIGSSPQNTTIQKGTSAQNTTTYIGSSTQNTTAFMGTSAQNTTTYIGSSPRTLQYRKGLQPRTLQPT